MWLSLALFCLIIIIFCFNENALTSKCKIETISFVKGSLKLRDRKCSRSLMSRAVSSYVMLSVVSKRRDIVPTSVDVANWVGRTGTKGTFVLSPHDTASPRVSVYDQLTHSVVTALQRFDLVHTYVFSTKLRTTTEHWLTRFRARILFWTYESDSRERSRPRLRSNTTF